MNKNLRAVQAQGGYDLPGLRLHKLMHDVPFLFWPVPAGTYRGFEAMARERVSLTFEMPGQQDQPPPLQFYLQKKYNTSLRCYITRSTPHVSQKDVLAGSRGCLRHFSNPRVRPDSRRMVLGRRPLELKGKANRSGRS